MMEKTKEPDLIEKIAKGLPLDIRAEFLNELRYMRSLPENDEMLRILRVMMFLTHMTEQVPMRILTEREKFENTCREAIIIARELKATGNEYFQELSRQLTQLPGSILTGVNPKEIAALINDNLKKQFEISTIPIVARKLADNAKEIRAATNEYERATYELCGSWQSAADEARKAINEMQTKVSGAATAAEKAIDAFKISLDESYTRMQKVIGVSALIAGVMFGMGIVFYFLS